MELNYKCKNLELCLYIDVQIKKNLINYVIIYRNRINTSEMGLMMFTIDIIIFAF